MPSSIFDLVGASGADYGGAVRWSDPVPERGGGIYLISRLADPRAADVARIEGSVDRARIRELLVARPELILDGHRPTVDELEERIERLWIQDEPVLYIGKATSLSRRVGQYYVTRLGARSPHAGGWALKTVRNIEQLFVHWATHEMPELAEQQALAAFVENVSDESRAQIHVPGHPYPFANLEGPGGRKAHGIRGARAPSGRSVPSIAPKTADSEPPDDGAAPPTRVRRLPRPSSGGGYDALTQPVTAADKAAGRVRIPRDAKWLFPKEPCDLPLQFRGETMTVRWNPRLVTQEKSGTLGVGKERAASTPAGTRLPIRRGSDALEIG